MLRLLAIRITVGIGPNSNKENTVSYYSLPKVCDGMTQYWRQLLEEQRALWLSRLRCQQISNSSRVCSAHFIKGSLFIVAQI